MWLALGTLVNNKTPAINGDSFHYLRYRGDVFPPRRVPRLPPKAADRDARHRRLLLGRQVRNATRL